MEVLCKQGKLKITENSVQVVAPLNKMVWMIQRSTVQGVSLKRGLASGWVMADVIFNTPQGAFTAQGVKNSKVQEIIKMFS